MKWDNAKIFGKPLTDIVVVGVFAVVACCLVLSGIWAYKEFISSPPYVDREKYPVMGIDISSHNGEIDFKKVAESGIEFVFMKVSEGRDFNDSRFNKNYEAAVKAGLKIGFYHFFRFDRNGVEQAINFIETIGDRKSDLGLAIDVEKAGNKDSIPVDSVVSRLTAMVDYLNLSGHRVTFYTNLEGYYEYIADYFPGSLLWICRFKQNPINAEWTFWQYSHSGKIDGINGKVDLNVFCGNRNEWKNYLEGGIWPYVAPVRNNDR